MIDFPTLEERRAEAMRLLAGVNATWAAQRMGSSKATVGLWKRGARVPDLENLLRLAIATERPLDATLRVRIFGDAGPPEQTGRKASA